MRVQACWMSSRFISSSQIFSGYFLSIHICLGQRRICYQWNSLRAGLLPRQKSILRPNPNRASSCCPGINQIICTIVLYLQFFSWNRLAVRIRHHCIDQAICPICPSIRNSRMMLLFYEAQSSCFCVCHWTKWFAIETRDEIRGGFRVQEKRWYVCVCVCVYVSVGMFPFINHAWGIVLSNASNTVHTIMIYFVAFFLAALFYQILSANISHTIIQLPGLVYSLPVDKYPWWYSKPKRQCYLKELRYQRLEFIWTACHRRKQSRLHLLFALLTIKQKVYSSINQS